MDKTRFLSSAMCDEEVNKLTERRNALVTEIAEKRTEFESADVERRDAILTEIESKNTDIESIDAEIGEVKELRSQFEKQEERMGTMKQFETEAIEERKMAVNKDVFDTPEYRAAWKNYIVTGNEKEMRDVVTGLSTGTENIPIPTIMQGYVETAWEKYGKFSRLVNKTYAKGYLAIPYEKSATGAVVHTELAEAPDEEAIELGQIELKPAMLKKWISLTDELIALAPEEFMRYVADELVYQVVLALDHGIINGALDTNSKGVVGILGNALTEEIEAPLNFNAVNEAIAELRTFDNLVVAMNQKTFFKNVMGLTDLQGRPIYQIAADNTGKPRYFMNGIRVEFTEALPDYDTAIAGTDDWALVGNFQGYRLNLPEGESVRTLYDPYTSAKEDKVVMVGRLFAAGNVTRMKHFCAIKKPAAGGDD